VNILYVFVIQSYSCNTVLGLSFFTLCLFSFQMFETTGRDQQNYISSRTHVPLDSKPLTMITFRLEISSIIYTGVVHRILRVLIYHTPKSPQINIAPPPSSTRAWPTISKHIFRERKIKKISCRADYNTQCIEELSYKLSQ